MYNLVVGSLGYRLVADMKSRKSSSTPRGPQVPRRFCFVLRFRRAPPSWWRGITEAVCLKERGRRNGSGKREVVQRCEGVWLYLPGRRRGRVCALQRHPGPGLQELGRG